MEPIWTPSQQRVENANVTEIVRRIAARYDAGVTDYTSLQRFSVEHMEAFWDTLWDYFDFVGEKGQRVLENGESVRSARWFPDARLNFTENVLRRRDDRIALVSLTEDQPRRTVTYTQIYDGVSRLKSAMTAAGIGEGDRVVSCLPNIPEAIVAVLATASIGAVWCACSPDYSEQALLDRIAQVEPRILFTSDGYSYGGKRHGLLEKASALAASVPSIETVIVVPHLEAQPDLNGFEKAVTLPDYVRAFPASTIEYQRFPFEQPLFVFFSSGTTGKPKAVIHHAGGHLISHLKDMVLQSDVHRGDVCFWPVSTGWVIWSGYVPILAWDVVLVLYEGSVTYPGLDFIFDVVDREKPSRLRLPPPLIDRFVKEQLRPQEKYDLSSIETVTSGGAALLPHHYEYVYEHIKADVHLSSPAGGTDVNTTLVSGDPTGPVYVGETQCAALGIAVDVFDDEGMPLRGRAGELVCTKPFPSMAVGFWNDPEDKRFQDGFFSTFPNVWRHGDWAEITPRDRFVLRGRSDATLKVNGVRMGTSDIYVGLEGFSSIKEAVAISLATPRGDEIVLFVQLAQGERLDPQFVSAVKQAIRQRATPRHVPARIVQVPDIPRSANGKASEVAVRDTILGRPVNTSGLSNPDVLKHFTRLVELELEEPA